MKWIKTVTLLMIISIALNRAEAQAWVKEKGKFYAKLGVNSTNSQAIFDQNSKQIDSLFGQKIPHLHEIMYQFYGQYGVSNGVNVVASIPFKSVYNVDDGFSRSGIADMEVGATFAWQKETWNITPALFVGIPSGYYYSNTTLNRTFSNEELILGDGEWNVMPRLYFGRGIANKPVYITGFGGFNYRTGGRFHEIDAFVEAGYTKNKFIFIFKMQWKESLNNGTNVPTFTGIYDNAQEFLSPHFSLYYKHTPKLHFSLNIGGAVYAHHAQAAPSVNLGVAYEN